MEIPSSFSCHCVTFSPEKGFLSMSSETRSSTQVSGNIWRTVGRVLLIIAAVLLAGALVWQGITSSGNPDPTVPHLSVGAAILNTALLVFREGLETILVLSAITASLMRSEER